MHALRGIYIRCGTCFALYVMYTDAIRVSMFIEINNIVDVQDSIILQKT